MTTPYILSIPRELREIIYGYLWRPTELQWGFRYSNAHRYAVEVYIDRAHVLNVLLTCSRLYDEYRKMPFFRNVSITVDHWSCWSRKPCGSLLREGSRRLDSALSKLRQVTFLVSFGMYIRDPWDDIHRFAEALNRQAPRLTIFRVAFKQGVSIINDHGIEKYPYPYTASLPPPKPVFLLRAPINLVNLPVMQYATGHGVRYLREGHLSRESEPWNWQDRYASNLHCIERYALFLYTRATAVEYFWGASDAFKYWRPASYPGRLRRKVGTGAFRAMTGRLYKMREWTETSGEETKALILSVARL